MSRRWILLSAYLLTYIAVASLITLIVRYVTGPAWLLSEVYITGHEDAVGDVKIFKPQNLLFLDTRILKKQLESQPLIKSAEIKKAFPDQLQILLTERFPIIKLRSSDAEYWLDADGVTLPKLARFTVYRLPEVECGSLIIINGQGKQISKLLPLLLLIREINREVQITILRATCLSPAHYSLATSEQKILVDVAKKPADTVASLLFLVKQFRIEGKWPQVIDLRFDKPVLQQTKMLNPESATKSAREQP